MSWIGREVLEHSHTKNGARLVMLTLAEYAHGDGVTWVSQEKIAKLAALSVRGTRDAINEAVEAKELEVRKAQRGRKRINVYRIVVGAVRDVEIDYDRLPFDLNKPFSRPADFAGGQDDDRQNGAPDDRQFATPHARATVGVDLEPSERSKEIPSGSPAFQGLSKGQPEPGKPKPPPVMKVYGRNLGWDALVKATGASERMQSGQIGAALKKIRAAYAEDFPCRSREEGYLAAWERALADEIKARARLYREVMSPEAMLTPTALAKWWDNVTKRAQGRFSDEEWERLRQYDMPENFFGGDNDVEVPPYERT